eukprot:TRINITY_DN14451_c0_g1_i1.p1 TRINITY_DN14451_c0_g1~~TRINITY_DN14451_c0_g1_i1.p1  ORF type:complete len:265 (+),score=61.75 TRINITY_DN14451_c0_g1_i1:125-919(+)
MQPDENQFGNSKFNPGEKSTIQRLLEKKLGKEEVQVRDGPAGKKVAYVATGDAIRMANEIFGPNGWSSSVVSLQQDFLEEIDGKFRCGCTAVVRIQLKDGTYHEDVGYGVHKGATMALSIENSKKTAVSDGLKRALRLFGNYMGNSLGDINHVNTLLTEKGLPPNGTTEDLNAPRHDIMMDTGAANNNSSGGMMNRPPPSGGAPPKYNARAPPGQQPKYGNYNRPPPNQQQNVPRMPPKQPYMPNNAPNPQMNGVNPPPYPNMN